MPKFGPQFLFFPSKVSVNIGGDYIAGNGMGKWLVLVPVSGAKEAFMRAKAVNMAARLQC